MILAHAPQAKRNFTLDVSAVNYVCLLDHLCACSQAGRLVGVNSKGAHSALIHQRTRERILKWILDKQPENFSTGVETGYMYEARTMGWYRCILCTCDQGVYPSHAHVTRECILHMHM